MTLYPLCFNAFANKPIPGINFPVKLPSYIWLTPQVGLLDCNITKSISSFWIFDNAVDTALSYYKLTTFPFSSTTLPLTISAQDLGVSIPANTSGQIEITSLSFKKWIAAEFLLFFPLYLQFSPIIQALTNTFIFVTSNPNGLLVQSTIKSFNEWLRLPICQCTIAGSSKANYVLKQTTL